MVEPIFDYQFRIILIGDSTVGKTTLLKAFTEGTFANLSDPTVGVDFYARLIEVRDGTRVKLQLWDTAGQERFRSIVKTYYRNSVGVLLLYDVTKQSSFEHLPQWLYDAKQYIDPTKAVFQLVGCKHDLADLPEDDDSFVSQREVSHDEAKQFAGFYGMKWVETSAKSGQNVEQCFASITQQIYDKIKSGDFKTGEEGWEGIKNGFARSGENGSQPRYLLEAQSIKSGWCC